MVYIVIAFSSMIIGAILHRQLIALALALLKLALVAWVVRSLFSFNPELFAFQNISGFAVGALVGFLVIGVLCSRLIYRQLVRADERLEIDKARKHAQARLEM
jgi:hypothetical protein